MDRSYFDHFLGGDAYVCAKCQATSLQLFPFCPMCGTQQPVQEELEVEAKRPSITDIEAIKKALDKLKGQRIRLWDYCVSLTVVQLRVAHPPAATNVESVNTVIACSGTRYLQAPTAGWDADLSLEVEEGQHGQYYCLIDKQAGMRIESHSIFLYENMPAYYAGSN